MATSARHCTYMHVVLHSIQMFDVQQHYNSYAGTAYTIDRMSNMRGLIHSIFRPGLLADDKVVLFHASLHCTTMMLIIRLATAAHFASSNGHQTQTPQLHLLFLHPARMT